MFIPHFKDDNRPGVTLNAKRKALPPYLILFYQLCHSVVNYNLIAACSAIIF